MAIRGGEDLYLPTRNEGFPFPVLYQVSPENIHCTGWGFHWRMEQVHARLLQFASPFAMVARRARRDYIRPGMFASKVARQYVIEGQVCGVTSAVLTDKVVSAEHFTSAELNVRARAVDHVLEANHGRPWISFRDRLDVTAAVNEQSCLSGEYQPHGPPRIANIDRFEVGIQDQYRDLHWNSIMA